MARFSSLRLGAWGPRPSPALLLRRELPGADGRLGDGIALRRDLDVFDFGPALGERAVEGRERIAGLAGSVDVERAVEIGEIVDGAIARGVPVGERRALAEFRLAAVQRISIARAWHLDVEVRADAGEHSERPVLAMGVVRRSPGPFRTVGAIPPLEVLKRGGQRCSEYIAATLPRRSRTVVAPVAGGGAALQQPQQGQRARVEVAIEGPAQV